MSKFFEINLFDEDQLRQNELEQQSNTSYKFDDQAYEIYQYDRTENTNQATAYTDALTTFSKKSYRGKQLKLKKIILTNVKIIQISAVETLQKTQYFKKKRYQIKLYYILREKPTKVKQFTIRFGNRKQEDYIDNLNEKIKLRRQLQYYDFKTNPFHPGYWAYHLCNTCETMDESYELQQKKF